MGQPEFVMLSFPAQGHLNPALRFAKRLTGIGAKVNFITTHQALTSMNQVPSFDGLSISSFEALDTKGKVDPATYMSELKRRSTECLSDLIVSKEKEGNPVTCVIYTIFLPWVPDVARGFHVPVAMLWIQPAIVLDIYYFYFRGYGDRIVKAMDECGSIELPGLPLLNSDDLPTFLLPSNPYHIILPTFQEHVEELDKVGTRSTILVNTFDDLEAEALRAVEKFDMVAIGPLIPSAFVDGKDDACDKSLGGELFQGSHDGIVEWLDSKPQSSVVYVAFGTLAELTKRQLEEVAQGLLDSGHPFLWVIREKKKLGGEEEEGEVVQEEELSCREELEQQGKIVKWCSQMEVLSHSSLGCFLTHCGWNSTSESLVAGVPMVGYPQWSDQPTSAKLIEDVWKVGVRVKVKEEGIAESKEIKRCLDEVMESGERGEEFRRNARKWRGLAREAVKEGGQSDRNLRAFVEEITQAQSQTRH